MGKLEWKRPEIVTASGLPAVLGDCSTGQTEIAGQGCGTGNYTGGGNLGEHTCFSGSIAFGANPSCIAGTSQLSDAS